MLKEAQLQKLVEEYDNSILEKLAGAKDVWTSFNDFVNKNPGIHLALPLAAGVLGATADSTIGAIKDWLAKRNITKIKDAYFAQMLEAHPALRKESPELVAQYWESLYHFAPNMAQDPLAAGAYIMQSIKRDYMGQFGGPPTDVYRTLTDIQRGFNDRNNIVPIKKKPFLEHYTQTANITKSLVETQKLQKEMDKQKP